MKRTLLIIVAACLLVVPARGAGATTHTLQFSVFAHTSIRLTDLVWTGRQFLFVDNTSSRVFASGPDGANPVLFATMPRQVEETRCRVSPATGGFTPGTIFCHAPDNKVYRISTGGKPVSTFASLPTAQRADGALTFDTVGRFGLKLIVATGRSGGGAAPPGGTVFTIDAAGNVSRVGTYTGPGGADEIAIAPPSLGAFAGDLLLTVDAGKAGSLVAMDSHGTVKAIVKLSDGPNPLAILTSGQSVAAGQARPGLYVTDTLSHDVFFAPASELAPYAGDVLLGSELGGHFWVLHASGASLVAQPVPTNLQAKHYNLEGALYITG